MEVGLSPMKLDTTEHGLRIQWQAGELMTRQNIGIDMPQKPNCGPLAALGQFSLVTMTDPGRTLPVSDSDRVGRRRYIGSLEGMGQRCRRQLEDFFLRVELLFAAGRTFVDRHR